MLGSCKEHSTRREQIKNNSEENSQFPHVCACRKTARGCVDCDKLIPSGGSQSFEPNEASFMLSVIIPTEGVERPAVATLAALVPGAAAGLIREVLLVDRGGSSVIERVADVAGCCYLASDGTRAAALAAGARQARSPWLMFLHAGAVLDPGWIGETTQFIHAVADGGWPRA